MHHVPAVAAVGSSKAIFFEPYKVVLGFKLPPYFDAKAAARFCTEGV